MQTEELSKAIESIKESAKKIKDHGIRLTKHVMQEIDDLFLRDEAPKEKVRSFYEADYQTDLKDYVLAAMHGNGQYGAWQVFKWAKEIKEMVDNDRAERRKVKP